MSGGNEMINNIFSEFQKCIDIDESVREDIRINTKKMDKLSREISTVLQVIHHTEEDIAPACLKARMLFDDARKLYKDLKDAVPPGEYFKYHDHWRNITQRYCFLISLTIWLEKGIMARLETVAEILGICAEEKDGFHLETDDYLIGLLNLCTELSRLAVNSVSRSEFSRPIQISKFVMDINAGFRLLNMKNDLLRKRFDAFKYDVKKIEEVVYDLNIRGLLNESSMQDGKRTTGGAADSPPKAESPTD